MKKKDSRRGRPPKENKATASLSSVRVTPDQKERYKAAAKKAGLSLSRWIRDLADENS